MLGRELKREKGEASCMGSRATYEVKAVILHSLHECSKD